MWGTTASAARTLFSVIPISPPFSSRATTFSSVFSVFILKERRHLEAADGLEAGSRHLGKESTHQAAGATQREGKRR